MKAATFSGPIQGGHKGSAIEVPFDPAERWGAPAVSLRAGRRGHFVRGRLNGKLFESVVVARARRFFVLVGDELREELGLRTGQSVKVSIQPSGPAAASSSRHTTVTTTSVPTLPAWKKR